MKVTVQLDMQGQRPSKEESPIRKDFLPLTRPWIGEEEKREVMDTFDGVWLSRGPKVSRFEEEFDDLYGSTITRLRFPLVRRRFTCRWWPLA